MHGGFGSYLQFRSLEHSLEARFKKLMSNSKTIILILVGRVP